MSYGINNLSSRSRPSIRTPKDGDDAAAVAGTTDTIVDFDADRETRGKGEVEVEGEEGKIGSSLIAFLDKDDDDDSDNTDGSIMLEGSSEEGRTEEGPWGWMAVLCAFHWTKISD